MKPFLVIIAAFVSVLLSSCNKPEPIGIDISRFWTEHHKTVWDSASTANHLVGSWKLTYRFCCQEPSAEIKNVENENYRLSITADTVYVFVGEKLTQQSTWSLEIRDADLFGIETEPYVANTYGRILFADDKVLFNNSYIDGADNYFERVVNN